MLAPKPGYPLIESIARLCGVKTVEYQLQFDGSWYMDIAALQIYWNRTGKQAGTSVRLL